MATSFDYQRIIARLIVDESFYDSFVADRDEAVARLGLADGDRARLTLLDAGQLAVFKDVVNSTRAINFSMIFSEIAGRLTEEDWQALLARFQREVVVRDATDSADLVAFCDWLDEQFPGSAGAALARYQMALQLMGTSAPTTGTAGTTQLAPRTYLWSSGFDLDTLFDVTVEELWVIGRAGEPRHYVLQGTLQDEDVSIVEVPYQLACLLGLLRRPRQQDEIVAALGSGDHGEVLAELTDAGLVVVN